MVSKVHVANRRLPPPRRPSWTGGRRVTAGGGGRGRGPNEEGWGARASSPFLWNKGKSVSEASVTPGRAKTVGRVGLATRRKFVRAGTPGPGEGQSSLLRGLCASPVQGGAANMESGRRAGGGGAEVGAQPPLFPSPSVPSSEHKAERARSGGPAPQESACAEYRGRGWEPNFFLPQNGHVSCFFFSCRVPPGQVAGLQGSYCCFVNLEVGGVMRGEGALSARGPIRWCPMSHVLRCVWAAGEVARFV